MNKVDTLRKLGYSGEAERPQIYPILTVISAVGINEAGRVELK